MILKTCWMAKMSKNINMNDGYPIIPIFKNTYDFLIKNLFCPF